MTSTTRSRDEDHRPAPAFVRIPVPIPSTESLGGLARRALETSVRTTLRTTQWSIDTVVLFASLPGRLETLLTELERMMARVSVVVDAAAATTADAGRVVAGAEDTSARAQTLIADLEPISALGLPLGRRFVENFSEEELDAAIALVDHLPEVLERMEGLMPILEQMDTIAPEIHQLLEVTTDVRKAVIGIPGFKFFRNRGEDKTEL